MIRAKECDRRFCSLFAEDWYRLWKGLWIRLGSSVSKVMMIGKTPLFVGSEEKSIVECDMNDFYMRI